MNDHYWRDEFIHLRLQSEAEEREHKRKPMNTDLFNLPPQGDRPRRLSSKQAIIVAHLRDNPEMTLDDAVRLIGGDIYCNEEKHCGAVLSNMVRKGMIERVRPGVFRLPPTTIQT